MAGLIPGYEYDIFISYRQNDNKYDGWVTEFIDNLTKELEATSKDKISIYFDANPHDDLTGTSYGFLAEKAGYYGWSRGGFPRWVIPAFDKRISANVIDAGVMERRKAYPVTELIRESLSWFDKYLGKVR